MDCHGCIRFFVGANENSIEISVPGRYLVKESPIKRSFDGRVPVIAIGIVCIMSLLIFIISNKRYWLW